MAEAIRAALEVQTVHPDRFLVIDSSSEDATVDVFREAGAEIRTIERAEFNHGGTRQLGARILSDADVIVYLTQDAIPADVHALERLVACFKDDQVAAAFGRQIPHSGATPIEAHARYFNYPETSRLKSWDDREVLGIKTVFISNSFAAYRRTDLMEVGGFPEQLIMGEDTYVAARLLQKGKKVAYSAEAMVFHSHDYSLTAEFRRYFDTGVLHAREPWIRESFGGPGGEGWRFLKSEMGFVLQSNPLLLPSVFVRTALKLTGFRLGLQERRLPLWVKRRFSMFRPYWRA
jgi:rhamnosyltransferase